MTSKSQLQQSPISVPNERGYFGKYGGRFVPETLIPALDELIAAYTSYRNDCPF